MTISSASNTAGPFAGNGSTTSFPFAFKVFSRSELLLEVTDVDGVVSTLVLDSDFSVSLNADQDASPGGTITYPISGAALATGETLIVSTDLPYTQLTDITNAGGFLPQVIEDALDRNVRLMQQQAGRTARAVRAPLGEDMTNLPPASERANMLLTFDEDGNPAAVAAAAQSATALQILLAGTGTGQGGSQVGLFGGGTLQDAIDAFVYAGSGSDDTTALSARDAAAAAAGKSLILNGDITVSAAITFAAYVIPSPGAQITTSGAGGGTKWLVFAGGVGAGLHYWLDTDWPTSFFKTEAIYPQWFGATGLFADNNTTAVTRALLACRANTTASATPNGMPDAQYPCGTVRFTGAGVYRISGVPLYCGTTLEFVGEGGSINGTAISQISNLTPAFYVCPLNVAVDGTVTNNGVGQNFITGGKYYSEIPASASDGEPIFAFLSPAQAYTQLGLSGTPGTVGHIDTSFRRVWGLNCNTFAKVTAGALWVHFEDSCQFDVCRRICYHTGTSYGMVSAFGVKGYAITWGSYTWDSTDTSTGYRLDVHGGEYKAGNCGSTDANQRRAININSTAAPVAGTFCKIVGANFLSTTISSTRHGGPIFVNNGCESVYLSGVTMDNADSANDQKFIAIQSGVKHLSLGGRLVSRTLAAGTGYATATMVQFSQAVQTLTDIQIDLTLVNENGAGTFASAISSNFVLTGCDLDRVSMSGNFTALCNSNVNGRGRPINTVASAATIALPPNGDVFLISGATNITSVTAQGWTGRVVRLIFQGALTFTDGLNLKLAGNLVTTADDTITLACDGTNFYELARSVN